MKIAVIGTVMRDEIHTARGERRESFGGILYNVVALAAMTRRTDRILPICHLGAEHLELLRERYFSRTPQIDASGIRISPDGTDQNVLRYRTQSDREEQMTINTPPLAADHLSEAVDARAILINFINGREISLDALRELRASTNAHLHLDIHNLGKKIDATGRLAPHGLPDWREWLALVDTVQANEWEAELITGRKPTTEEEYRAFVLELLSVPALKAAALTIGGLGSVLVHRLARDGRPRLLRVPAMPVAEIVDTTGCGDCYSSAFVLELLRSGNVAKAALLATTLSGLKTQGGGLDDLGNIARGLELSAYKASPELLERIQQGYLGELIELST